MTSINTVLPTVSQADLSKDEEAIYRAMIALAQTAYAASVERGVM